MATVIVALLPAQIYFGRPLWSVPSEQGLPLLGFALAYLLGVLMLVASHERSQTASWQSACLSVLAGFGLAFLVLLIDPRDYSRGALTLSLVTGLALAAGSALLGPERRTRVQIRTALAGLLVLAAWGGATASKQPAAGLLDRVMGALAEPKSEVSLLSSSLYNLSATVHSNYFDVEMAGGGIAVLGEGYLVATADGRLRIASPAHGSEGLQVQDLVLDVPLNRLAYLDGPRADDPATFFRVTDILVEESALDVHLYVAHSFWNQEAQCIVMRLSEAHWPSARLPDVSTPWRTVYESDPCLPYGTEAQGGRMTWFGEGQLLLALGDQDRDGVKNAAMFAQEPGTGYGKTLLINVESGAAVVYSSGHRNPQGLLRTPSGEVWSTEHGPQGGDELNRVVRGANYGWPLATYGTQYFETSWPLSERPGSHDGYTPPAFSWIPAIGVSNLLEVQGSMFDLWGGDIIVSSLRAEALWRVRLRDNAVAYVEAIPVGARIRDILQDEQGQLVLWTDDGSLTIIRPVGMADSAEPSAEFGRLQFTACAACHSVDGRSASGSGPDLKGILGRSIAGMPGFRYSPGMARLEGTWTRERLLAFLNDPASFAPGNAMAMPGIKDLVARQSLVEYLVTLP